MCGLFGIVSPASNGFDNTELDILEKMTILNQLRGDDSTGMVAIDNKDIWKWARKVGHPGRFLNDARAYGEIRSFLFQKGRLAFGHGRAATRGSADNVENAHPFMITREDKTNLILVHNGTLDYWQELDGFSDFQVDSKWMATQIATLGAEEALSKIHGAIATIWWDDRDGTLNIYRNNDRPLHLATTERGHTLMNSDPEILDYMLFRYSAELGKVALKPYSLGEFYWASMVPNKDEGWVSKQIDKPKVQTYSYKDKKSNFTRVGRSKTWTRRQGSSILTQNITDGTELTEINPYDEGTVEYEFVEGWLEMVEWKDGQELRYYQGGTVVKYENSPVVDNVVKKYYRPERRQIVTCRTQENRPPNHYLVSTTDVERDVEALDLATTSDDETSLVVVPIKPVGSTGSHNVHTTDVFDQELDVTFRGGKPARWSTKTRQGVTLNHMAISETDYPTFFTYYENTNDGKWRVGQPVQLEYFYSEKMSTINPQPVLKAICGSVSPKQEIAINFTFQTDKYTREQLRQVGFFKARIKWMRCLREEEREKENDKNASSSVLIEAYVIDVEPLQQSNAK